MGRFNIKLMYDLPRCLVQYLLINYLDITDIKKVIIHYPKLFTIGQKKILERINKGMLYCSTNGYLEEMKIMYKKELIFDYYEAFYNSCINNHIETAKWLYSLNIENGLDIHKNSERVFRFSCFAGHIQIAKWLYSLKDNINIHIGDECAFRYSCYSGNLELAKWLLLLDKHNNISNNIIILNDAFSGSCKYGKIETAKWLYNLYPIIDIHMNNDEIFINSCLAGHIELSKWLYSLDNINIHIDDNRIFKSCCIDGKMEIVKWLFTLDTIESFNIYQNNNWIFRFSCANGNLDTIQWLYSIDTINMFNTENIEELIKYCDMFDNIEISKWLRSL